MAKKRELTALLPITPCTPKMRDAIIAMADERSVSIAQIQREAYSVFLASANSKATNNSKAS